MPYSTIANLTLANPSGGGDIAINIFLNETSAIWTYLVPFGAALITAVFTLLAVWLKHKQDQKELDKREIYAPLHLELKQLIDYIWGYQGYSYPKSKWEVISDRNFIYRINPSKLAEDLQKLYDFRLENFFKGWRQLVDQTKKNIKEALNITEGISGQLDYYFDMLARESLEEYNSTHYIELLGSFPMFIEEMKKMKLKTKQEKAEDFIKSFKHLGKTPFAKAMLENRKNMLGELSRLDLQLQRKLDIKPAKIMVYGEKQSYLKTLRNQFLDLILNRRKKRN